MTEKRFVMIGWLTLWSVLLTVSTPAAGTVEPYTTTMVTDYVSSLKDNPWVLPTLSDDTNLVLGQSHGWAANPTVPQQDLYGFKITNPASTLPRTKIVMISGNHNTEYSGNWALKGAVDFLVSDDARAAWLRNVADMYVYPMVNPDGRYLLTGRGNPELTSMGYDDHNRVWNKTGISTIDALTGAIKRDTGGTTDYFFDFHDNANYNCLLTVYPMWKFCQVLEQRILEIRVEWDSGVSGMSRRWAMSMSGLNATYAFTPEFTSTQSGAYYEQMGQDYALALYDTLIPEPATLLLLGTGILTIRMRRR